MWKGYDVHAASLESIYVWPLNLARVCFPGFLPLMAKAGVETKVVPACACYPAHKRRPSMLTGGGFIYSPDLRNAWMLIPTRFAWAAAAGWHMQAV